MASSLAEKGLIRTKGATMTTILVALVLLSLMTGPAMAQQAKAPQAKAPGYFCQGESKKHTPHGDKGTPFSQCVTAMAKMEKGTATSPKEACAGMSKKHVKGQKGTPFSICVQAGKKLMASQQH